MSRIHKILATAAFISVIATAPVMAAPKDRTVKQAEDAERPERPEKPTPEVADGQDDITEEAVMEEAAEPVEEQENVAEEEVVAPTASKDDAANGYSVQSFDEMGDFIVKSSRSGFNCSQINFACMIPEGFTHGVILELENTTEDLKFRLVSTNSNKYTTHMAVPAGDYHVINCYVDGDTTMSYPMTLPKDFSLMENQTLTVDSTLKNYAEIEDEANRRLHPDEYPEEEADDVEIEVPEYDDSSVVPWRRLEHKGDGGGVITLVDKDDKVCKIPIDFILQITQTGGDRKGEYKYSTDGGETWSDTLVIRSGMDISVVTTNTLEESGLYMRFGTEEFLKFDEYSFKSDIEYIVKTEESNGGGRIRISSPDIIYNDSYKIKIKIMQTGDPGRGVFIYSLDNGRTVSDETTIPSDGQFAIPDTNILITFWADTDKDKTFMVSDLYSCEIKGDMSKKSMMPYAAGVGAFAFVVCFFIVYSLRRQKAKPWDYTLNVYKPVELPKRKKK